MVKVNLFVLFLNLFFHSILCCQNPLNSSYIGLKDGHYTRYYLNGNVKTIWTIENGNVQGDHKNYYRNGALMSKEEFDKGKFHGNNIRLNKNGDTLNFDQYIHDTLLFARECKFYKNGNLKRNRNITFNSETLIESPFTKTRTTPFKIIYDPNELFFTLENSFLIIEYYKTGETKSIIMGTNGTYDGKWMTFYKNGHSKVVASKENGQFDGIYQKFDSRGNLRKELLYNKGKAIKKTKY